MRQYSCITIVAVIIILVMQVLYIQSLYHNYKDSVASDIEDSLYVAMDREYHWRMRIARNKEPEKQHVMRYKLRSDMTPEEIDSLQRIDKDSIVMDMAIARNLGKTVSDMVAQIRQDIALEKGYPIRLHVLDSIFSGMTAKKIPYLISVLDKEKNVKASCGTLAEHAGYVYPLFPIGTKGLQYIRLEIQIPVWRFIMNHVMVTAVSLLLMITALGCVLYQLLVIRRKDILLRAREQTINGTIHDLKTPLNSIVAVLGWIKSGEPDNTKRKAVEIGQTEIRRMVYNIESLLITVRKDHSGLILKKEPVDMSALVLAVKRNMDILYVEKPHDIKIADLLPEGFRICADRMYMENVVRNLVENSLKYSDDGVQVTVTLSTDGSDFRLSVKDTGWGIAPRYHKKIFRQFFQVPRGEKRIRRGYGIGLAQCKYIIERHQGTIGVDSTEAAGSEFWFTLPMR